jgi:hypothetical protein
MKTKTIAIGGLLILLVAFQPMVGTAGDDSPAFPKNVKGFESIAIEDSSFFVIASRSSNQSGMQTINFSYTSDSGNGSYHEEINEAISLISIGQSNVTFYFPDNATYLVADDFLMSCYWDDSTHYSEVLSEPKAIILDLQEIDSEGEYDTCDISIDGNVNGYLYDDYLNLEDTGTDFTLTDTMETSLWYRIIIVEPLESSVQVNINATATNSPEMSMGSVILPFSGLVALILVPLAVLYFAILRGRREEKDKPSRKNKK